MNKEDLRKESHPMIRSGGRIGRKKMYILDMFPYPSSDGLHVGHVESYTGSDILARYFRHRGFNVMHPIGWDAFGLPAENYAIKQGRHPQETTRENIANFTRQLKSLGFSYDWSREINTSDPKYYKWTQWLFLKLYERGLAYRKKGKVNWCPACQTVLANEQVVDGKCERCGNNVVQKDLEQWYFKITKYAQRLLDDLEDLDWPEKIKAMQRNWIGRSEGAELTFLVHKNKLSEEMSSRANGGESRNPFRDDSDSKITAFTTRPDTLFGATYIVMAPEHELVDRIVTDDKKTEVKGYKKEAAKKSLLQRVEINKEKTGVFTGSYAKHPITGDKLPIWIADYVVTDYGTGAIMAVPAHDERDFEFAKKYDLPIVEVISPDGKSRSANSAFVDCGILLNSQEFDGKRSQEAAKLICERASGKWKVTYRLRDWLVSRQRYWGCPIPIIYCDKCGTVPVPEDQLPVRLPDDVDFKPTGESPLVQSPSFHNVTCPKCGGKAKRESDTMDTFVDSSWYFLRYADPDNNNEAFNSKLMKQWLPVDIYIGGAEHAVLHLLYARFITKYIFDEGLINFDEPFVKLRNQGMILGLDNQKMSKSRGNVINPDEIVNNYGPDELRLYEMFLGPFDQMKKWDINGIEGVFRFLKKLKYFFSHASPSGEYVLPQTLELINNIAKKIENVQFNTAISDFMIYLNNLSKLDYSKKDLEYLLIALEPFAPKTAQELWQQTGAPINIAKQSWPRLNEEIKSPKSSLIVIQINGKARGTVTVASETEKDDLFKKAQDIPAVKKHIMDKEIKDLIYIPGRVMNIVLK